MSFATGLFMFTYLVLLVCALYLVLSKFYRTGIPGVIGCLFIVLGAVIVLGEAGPWGKVTYDIPKWLLPMQVGVTFLIAQYSWRAYKHADKMTKDDHMSERDIVRCKP